MYHSLGICFCIGGYFGYFQCFVFTISAAVIIFISYFLSFSVESFSFLKMFLIQPIFSSLCWTCGSVASVLCFGFFGHKVRGVLHPWSGIKFVPPVLEYSRNCCTAREAPVCILAHDIFISSWIIGSWLFWVLNASHLSEWLAVLMKKELYSIQNYRV